MFIPRPDAAREDDEWRAFVHERRFGLLIAAGAGRDVPIPSDCKARAELLRRLAAGGG